MASYKYCWQINYVSRNYWLVECSRGEVYWDWWGNSTTSFAGYRQGWSFAADHPQLGFDSLLVREYGSRFHFGFFVANNFEETWVVIPYYFPTALSAALLWLVWRLTRPRVNPATAFPVGLTAKERRHEALDRPGVLCRVSAGVRMHLGSLIAPWLMAVSAFRTPRWGLARRVAGGYPGLLWLPRAIDVRPVWAWEGRRVGGEGGVRRGGAKHPHCHDGARGGRGGGSMRGIGGGRWAGRGGGGVRAGRGLAANGVAGSRKICRVRAKRGERSHE